MYSFLSDKKGISSVEISRKLKITQKTSWKMLHKIRCEMRDREGKLFGAVEIDETFVGGKNKYRHYNKRVKNNQGRALVDKAFIYGFVERD